LAQTALGASPLHGSLICVKHREIKARETIQGKCAESTTIKINKQSTTMQQQQCNNNPTINNNQNQQTINNPATPHAQAASGAYHLHGSLMLCRVGDDPQ
jgi:hypothetical protein